MFEVVLDSIISSSINKCPSMNVLGVIIGDILMYLIKRNISNQRTSVFGIQSKLIETWSNIELIESQIYWLQLN